MAEPLVVLVSVNVPEVTANPPTPRALRPATVPMAPVENVTAPAMLPGMHA